MNFLYNVGIIIYSFLIKLAATFNPKAKLFIKGRKAWKKNLAKKIETNKKYLWFHCASLGEFEQGRPIIEYIKKHQPEYEILLTFYSPSGYEIRKNYPMADIIMYLPIDTPRNARKFINIVRPEKAFFIKYEYWYFFIRELKKQNIPLYIISAIFKKNQLFFKNNFIGNWYKKILFNCTHFFVQDNKSADLLSTIGINNFSISGDTRFDRVAAIANGAKKIDIIESFSQNHKLLIAGSTWKPDEEILTEFINNKKEIKTIIAPHEVTQTNINRLTEMLKTPYIKLSEANESNIDKYNVLIIDSIGILSSIYRYGTIAYIGGGFGVGIHNILEAATFGLPVIFGPNYKKFKEAVDLIQIGGAKSVNNFNELNKTLNILLNENKTLDIASEKCKIYVKKNIGATKKVMDNIFY